MSNLTPTSINVTNVKIAVAGSNLQVSQGVHIGSCAVVFWADVKIPATGAMSKFDADVKKTTAYQFRDLTVLAHAAIYLPYFIFRYTATCGTVKTGRAARRHFGA